MLQEKVLEYLKEMGDDDLLDIFKEANSYDSSFDFVDVFDWEEIEYMFDTKLDAVRATIFGNVIWNDGLLRFDAYRNLESINDYELVDECKDYIEELAEWLVDHYQETSIANDIEDIINENQDEEE